MAGKGKGGNTVAAVWKIAEPLAKDLGLTIWDIRFVKEGASWYLRVYIDKPGGVGVDDCVNMSHAIDKPLDEEDPIEQSYYLEVSSPGLERELTRDEHFTQMIGEKIKLRLIRPVENMRDFSGVLAAYEDGAMTVMLDEETEMNVTKKETSWVRLDDFGGAE